MKTVKDISVNTNVIMVLVFSMRRQMNGMFYFAQFRYFKISNFSVSFSFCQFCLKNNYVLAFVDLSTVEAR